VINAPALHASNWYASPNATSSGNGSITNPWTLPIALTNTGAIHPGDTLNLRWGSYVGPAFNSALSGTSNSYVTVRSYPGEWAVITDGRTGTLTANLDAGSGYEDGITMSGFHGINYFLRVDNELVWVVAETSLGVFRWNRGQMGTTPAIHTNGTTLYLTGTYLNQCGSNVIFRDFEITSTTLTNRNVDDGSANTMPGGLNFSGTGNKALGLIIHNVGEPAIGWAGGGSPSEVNGCLFWGIGMYDPVGTQFPYGGTNYYIRGSPIYGAGSGNLMKDCISFRNFTTAGKFFTSSGLVNNSGMVGNIGFMNPLDGFEMASGNGPMTNCVWQTNYMFLDSPMIGWNLNGNVNFTIVGNTIVGGMIKLNEVASGVVSNNVVFQGPAVSGNNFTTRTTPWTNCNVLWNYNTYYSSMTDLQLYGFTLNIFDMPNTTNSSGGGRLLLGDWRQYTGFDSNSTYTAGWPTNYLDVSVRRLDYDANRFHICVVSTSGQTNAPLTLSSYGFSPGDSYELRDAQNYFTVIALGIYNGRTINLPLNLTNVPAIPGVTHFANEHTNVKHPGLFNAFVLCRNPSPAVVTNFRVTSP
jgi:hypothetical protein